MTRPVLPILCALALAGCASFDQREIATVRARGVPEPVVQKLDRGEPVEPRDMIELTRRGVPVEFMVRQIEDHGVDSVIARDDVLALREAGVPARVIDALLVASDRFANRYSGSDVYVDDFYGTPIGVLEPRPIAVHGSVGVGFSTSGRHWRR